MTDIWPELIQNKYLEKGGGYNGGHGQKFVILKVKMKKHNPREFFRKLLPLPLGLEAGA